MTRQSSEMLPEANAPQGPSRCLPEIPPSACQAPPSETFKIPEILGSSPNGSEPPRIFLATSQIPPRCLSISQALFLGERFSQLCVWLLFGGIPFSCFWFGSFLVRFVGRRPVKGPQTWRQSDPSVGPQRDQLFRGLREVSGGAFWGLGGPWKPKVALEGKCAKTAVLFSSKAARPSICRRRDERDPHQVL